MSEEPAESGQGSPQAGVLGNLPSSRPAVRSPNRRTEPPKRRADEEAEAKAAPESEPAAAEPGTPGEQPVDLEALARGGIAVAGEAASLGLRLAGRAAAAVRDAVERR